MAHLSLFFLAAYLVVIPFYVLPSGMPQPSDALLCFSFICFFAHALYSGKVLFPREAQAAIICTSAFVVYVVLVNLFWTSLLAQPRILIYPLFYVFNLLALLLIVSLFGIFKDSLLTVIGVACVISTVFQVLLFPLIGATLTEGVRQVIFFNNPNQLGHYAVLAGTLIALTRDQELLKPWVYYLGILSAVILVGLSLSKAAMIGIFALLAIELFRRRWAVPAILFAFVIVLVASGSIDFALLDNVIERLQSIGRDKDDSLEGRGYDRIINHPGYLIFGAGEGEPGRFSSGASVLTPREIHSSIGTIFFSYGLVGFALISSVIFFLFKVANLRVLTYLIPAFLYGLTHNGMRETMLWVVLASVLAIGVRSKSN